MRVCGVILAGGLSSRMGRDKSFLEIEGKPVITHIASELSKCCHKITIIANDPPAYEFLGLDVYQDRYQNKGPLAGMESAMHHSETDVFVMAACDMPFIHEDVYRYLINSLGQSEAVIPIYNDRIHPLSGIYTKEALPQIQKLLDTNQLKIRSLFNHMDVTYATEFRNISDRVLERHFFNMNYPDDYDLAKEIKRAPHSF